MATSPALRPTQPPSWGWPLLPPPASRGSTTRPTECRLGRHRASPPFRGVGSRGPKLSAHHTACLACTGLAVSKHRFCPSPPRPSLFKASHLGSHRTPPTPRQLPATHGAIQGLDSGQTGKILEGCATPQRLSYSSAWPASRTLVHPLGRRR